MSLFGFLRKIPKCKIAEVLQKANQLYRQKKYAKAVKLYQRILQSDSQHFAAKANMATAYFEQGNYVAALPLFQELCKSDSFNPWWQNYLSQIYQKQGQFTAAVDAALDAVFLSDGQSEHQLNLAYTIYETSDILGRDKMLPVLQKWYAKYPQNGIVKQCYKSFFTDENFKCSEPEYVEKLFDVFASDFDDVLTELEYNSPQEIANILASFFQSKSSSNKRIIDLGCGSGLCGMYIAGKIKKCELTGVDISANMLHEASIKNVYKKLIKSNIIDCFDNIKNKFDAVVASDVFTYFGTLNEVFAGVAKLLKKEGCFVFTVSENNQNEKDYFLLSSSRFVHSVRYVEKTLENNGFKVVENRQKILRKEGEKDVKGRIILAIKNKKNLR